MERVTVADLEAVCRRINRLVNGAEPDGFGAPLGIGPVWDPATRKARIGTYYIDGAYGGYALYRIMSEGGGVNDIIGGHMPKRELYNRMQAFIEGFCRGVSVAQDADVGVQS